jgi:flagellar biosynthesis/type III secretory pathway protein FliH
MKPWSKNIRFASTLRAVRMAGESPVEIKDIPAPLQPAPPSEAQVNYERGRIDGEKALSEALLRQRTELHQLMEGTLKSLRLAVPQVIRETENTLVAFALSVAQKLVSDLPISVPMVEAAVRDAMRQVEGTAQFTVRLHPADLQLLQNAGSPALSPVEDGREFRFLSSPEVTRGGCLVQTQFGTIDARRETKFDLLKAALAT